MSGLPAISPITTVFAPITNTLNITASMYESLGAGKFSAGILLTAPMTKLTTVTARDVDINLFSKASCKGWIQQKTVPYIPAMTSVKPM